MARKKDSKIGMLNVNKYLVISMFILLVGIAYLYGKSQSSVLGIQTSVQPTKIQFPITTPTAPTLSPIPQVIEKVIYQQITVVPTSTPVLALTPTITASPTQPVTSYQPSDFLTSMNKCLNNKKNDPLNQQAELDRQIYLNPNSTQQEKNAAIARLSTYNDIIGLKYDCYKSIPTAICNDRTYSYSNDANGTCSYHSGVAKWIAQPNH